MDSEFDTSGQFVASLYKPVELLPISRHRQSLLYAIDKYPVVILVGETGSGKTTQLPQFLEQAGWCNDGKQIAITQPRRVAVTSVAARVAAETRCELGQEVGYSIRFEDVTSATTRIKFVTDGLLLREALVDPLLSRYSVIMVDEAHERSVSTDVLLGVLKKIRKRRPELRIIVSSATLKAEDYMNFFVGGDQAGNDTAEDNSIAKIITLGGKMYPVDCLYLETPTEDYIERAIKTVFDIHANEPDGDILLFLTGREEINTATQKISEQAALLSEKAPALLPVPLYAGLTAEQQLYAFEPAPEDTRKVIVSTNVAEASVTIEGIVYVVDCGFSKLRAYDPSTGIEKLTTVPISKASATQRAGRAGRTKPGKCFRLYTEQSFLSLCEETSPEIQRSNLSPIILQLKSLGIDNVVRFDYISSPPSELFVRAFQLLSSLGAIDEYAKLTKPLGVQMAELPVNPMMAKVLLSSTKFGCLDEVLSIAAMTTLQETIWFNQDEKRGVSPAIRQFAVEEGDHLTYLNIYRAFVTKGKKDPKWCRDHSLIHKSMMKAVSVRVQLENHLKRFGIDMTKRQNGTATVTTEQIQRCLTTGFFGHAARMQPDGSFKSITGNITLHAHPSSLMFNRKAEWVIFNEILQTGTKTFIKDITKIEKSWLLEYAPEYYQIKK
ncbi:putative RNA helicase [Microsporum audouinii]